MAEEKKEKLNIKKILSVIGKGSFIVVMLFVLVYVITIVSSSQAFFDQSAKRGASLKADSAISAIEKSANQNYDNLYEVEAKVRAAIEKEDTMDTVVSVLIQYKVDQSAQFGDLRFFNDGKAYDPTGLELTEENSGHEYIEVLKNSPKQGCTPVYYDEMIKDNVVAFFIPVRNSSSIDGLMSIVRASDVVNVNGLQDLELGGVTVIIADSTGRVYNSVKAEDFGYNITNNVLDITRTLTGDVKEINSVDSALKGEETVTCILSSQVKYAAIFKPVSAFDGDLKMVMIVERDKLIADEISYVNYIYYISVIAAVCLAIALIYAIIYYRNARRTIEELATVDPVVGCPNGEAFKQKAAELIFKGQNGYAVVLMEIRQMRYLAEKYGEEKTGEMLRSIAKDIEIFILPREMYGYLGDGKFVLLVLNENKTAVADRTRAIEGMCQKHEMLGAKRERRIFNVGVSTTEQSKRVNVQQLINQAILACESSKTNMSAQLVVYDQHVDEEKERNAKIELEMESSLNNGEFRLFFQPKYNVAHDRIDSAEALVRWFDVKTGDYRFPGEFIPLFESNGFITKLDHYMYLEALKYLSSAAEKGEKVVPISVNVSLVTASHKDFLDFYISNKKKYKIGDNFIYIEFTESFLMEDHEKLYATVQKLHENGICCSLDDFGTGYASFNVLKNIPIDELKLDRMLLRPGYSKVNDEKLLETIITLAKSLKIRVVQEGVETKEMFDRVVEKGCDVVQGYYYAKAISLEEFKMFINTNTSIKYKSLVK